MPSETYFFSNSIRLRKLKEDICLIEIPVKHGLLGNITCDKKESYYQQNEFGVRILNGFLTSEYIATSMASFVEFLMF